MAKTSPQISRQKPDVESLDYYRLLRQGIRLCQQLAGDRWTDYNEHDPGITILEQLCYALTDLGYRTHFNIEDILAESRGGAGDTLYTGDRILTSSPLTVNDYRRLIYDRVSGVDNVWLKPVESHPLGIRGLYEVLIEAAEPGSGEDARELEDRIIAEVRQVLGAHRNLAEDVEWESITVLDPCWVTVKGTIVVGDEASPLEVLAAVLLKIQEDMVPDPVAYSVDELLKKGIPPEEIFTGPRLEYGCVDETALTELPGEITVAGVRNSILRVPGVREVKHLEIVGARQGKVVLKPGTVPYLEPSIYKPLPPGQDYPIQVETEGGMAFRIDRKRVWNLLQSALNARNDLKSYDYMRLDHSEYLKVPVGTGQNIENYFSIQHQFPLTYGIGRAGVPEDLGEYGAASEKLSGDPLAADPLARRGRRLAQARQLKGYLLFFEQLMANYLAQLAHAADLFSLEPNLDRTYFALPIAHAPDRAEDPPDVIELIANPRNRNGGAGLARYAVCLVDGRAPGETGLGAEILLKTPELAGAEEYADTVRQLIEAGKNPDHYRWETSSFGDIRLLLLNAQGQIIARGEERFISLEKTHEAIDFLSEALERLDLDPARSPVAFARIYPRPAISVRVVDENGRVLLNSGELPSEEVREKRVGQILRSGIAPEHYRIEPHGDGDFSVNLCDRVSRETIACGERKFGSRDQAREEIRELAIRLSKLRANTPFPDTFIQRLPDSSQDVRKRIVEEYIRNLDRLVKDTGMDFLTRRNRFLNHLLARFGESFDDESLLRLDPRNHSDQAQFYRELIRWKLEFLSRYATLGAARGRGFDVSEHRHGDTRPIRAAGLEQRLSLLLGLHGHSDERGDYRPSKKPLAGEENPQCPNPGFPFEGLENENPFEGEGLYLVEHILLRPPAGAMRTSETPAKDEFHSFRISLFLPAWPARLSDPGFRYFAEGVIRENCPAHIACRCFWLERPLMRCFEALYGEWETLKPDPGANPDEVDRLAAALKDFIRWLGAFEAGEKRDPDDLPRSVREAVAQVRRKHQPAEGGR
jgi:hypothetical protein